MDKLEQLRYQIDDIDKQMAILFAKRMEIVKEVALIKQENGLPIYDQGRESFILLRNGSYIENKEVRIMYFDLMTKQFELSKKMQENFLHPKKD